MSSNGNTYKSVSLNDSSDTKDDILSSNTSKFHNIIYNVMLLIC